MISFCIFIGSIASTFEFIVHSNLGNTYNMSGLLPKKLHATFGVKFDFFLYFHRVYRIDFRIYRAFKFRLYLQQVMWSGLGTTSHVE